MSFFEQPQAAPPRVPWWERCLDWLSDHPMYFSVGASALVAAVVFGLVFLTDHQEDVNGKPPGQSQFIDGPGETYGFHILIDGRTIPCISTGNGVSCDWGAR